MNVFQVLLRRQKLLIHQECVKRPKAIVGAFVHELQNLGYVLHQTALACCYYLRDETYQEILDTLKDMVGQRDYKPFYPNFPKQVMEASEAELFINAITHYFSFVVADATNDPNFIWLPKYEKETRKVLDEKIKLKILQLGCNDDAIQVLKNLLTANSSLSKNDKEELGFLLEAYKHQAISCFGEIKQKETLAVVGKFLLNCNSPLGVLNINNPTDVLRIACALCDGDVSLAEPTKFKKISRFARRELLNALEKVALKSELAEEMLTRKGRWIRLGEALHPGEYKNRFPRTLSVFKSLRENEKIITFNSNVEYLIKEKDVKGAVKLLRDRPGYLARRLDHLLRIADTPQKKTKIIAEFLSVATKVSTPVLLQLTKHFKNRENADRYVMPKGDIAKIVQIPQKEKIGEKPANKVVNYCLDTLIDRFDKMGSLGPCYIDPKLQNYLVPFSQRSASKSLHTVVRGSQIPLEGNQNTVRFFIWWKQDSSRVDLDLSSVLLDDQFRLVESIAYFNLRGCSEGKEYDSVHSGDVTSAPNGACEFIDINMNAYAKRGRYVAMCVNSYTHQKFVDLPECFAGWMLREKPNSGEVFEAKTVQNKLDVTSGTKFAIPLFIDLLERKVIWADMAAKPSMINNVSGGLSQIKLIGKAITGMINTKWTVYDLINLHVQSRGSLVDKEKATTVFDESLAFQPEAIASQFLK